MKTRLFGTAVLLAAAALAPSAVADETTFCNFFITSLPFTISTQGHYCLDRNLSSAATSGAAITIAVDYVTLDLNNFKLGGGGAGLATDAIGIYANNHSNLTIRGGNIRGFAVGIMVEGATGSSAQNILIENNVLDGNTKVGIGVYAATAIVRNNAVSNTGGSTSPSSLFCQVETEGQTSAITNLNLACTAYSDGPIEVNNNTVINTNPPAAGATQVYGINLYGPVTSRHVAYLNRVMKVGGPFNYGIFNATGVCRDNTVTNTSLSPYNCFASFGINSATP